MAQAGVSRTDGAHPPAPAARREQRAALIAAAIAAADAAAEAGRQLYKQNPDALLAAVHHEAARRYETQRDAESFVEGFVRARRQREDFERECVGA